MRQIGRRRGVVRRLGAVAALAAAGLAIAAGQAAGVERITDGGFEGVTCSSVDCTGPVWNDALNSGSGVGFLCATSVPNCKTNGSPAIGSKWALWWTDQSVDGSVWQSGIAIPGAPATLSFVDRPRVEEGTLTVQIDGSTVYQEGNFATFAYQRKTVSLDQFAGPGTHTLIFQVSLNTPTTLPASWEVDEVSLDAANAPAGPNAPTCLGRPATIVGTNASELLTGSAGADVIVASGGNDVVRAGGGADRVCGGEGNDQLSGQGGSDRLKGEAGRDKLTGGGGKGDVCKGGTGKDRAAKGCEVRKS